jgi:flagellar protein FliS
VNATHAYKQQVALGWSRIDMLLALYSGAIDRLERAVSAFGHGDSDATVPLLLRAQQMVTELFAGIDLKYGELPATLASLYNYVLWAISQGTPDYLQSSITILKTLREGLEGIRDQAMDMERSGAIPPIADGAALSQSA